MCVENAGIDPATSHMQSERSTIWANSPPPAEIKGSNSNMDYPASSIP